MRDNLPDEVADILKSYVYVYIDPTNGRPFYIGKGVKSRLFDHLNNSSNKTMADKIRKIGRDNVQIDILRYGLSDDQAILIEAAAIDLIGKENLINIMGGHDPIHGRTTPDEIINQHLPKLKGFGRVKAEELISTSTAKTVEVNDNAILITINQLYRSNMTTRELYEATRGIWRVSRKREKATFAFAVFRGIVREVYQIDKWYPAGTCTYQTRDSTGFKGSGRWEFSGKVAPPEIRDKYVGFSVGKSGQNPIRYVKV